MGISITQPAPQVDRSYTPRITGVTRLWGGYNLIANQLIQMGVDVGDLDILLPNGYDYFVFDELACIVYPQEFLPYFDPKTGNVIEYLTATPANFTAHYSDLTGRYPGYQTYLLSKTSYSAQSSNLNVYDAFFDTNIPLPFTQEDINTMNEILGKASKSYYVHFDKVVSPMANYYVVGVMYVDANGNYYEFHAGFKTIKGTDPWT